MSVSHCSFVTVCMYVCLSNCAAERNEGLSDDVVLNEVSVRPVVNGYPQKSKGREFFQFTQDTTMQLHLQWSLCN